MAARDEPPEKQDVTEHPLEGELVEIFGLSDDLVLEYKLENDELTPASTADFADYKNKLDANGLQGRCHFWNSDAQRYIVETFQGHLIGVPASCLKLYDPVLPELGGFHAAWPAWQEDYPAFGAAVSTCLSNQGFCFVQMFSNLEGVLGDAKGRNNYFLLREELQAGLLGDASESMLAYVRSSSNVGQQNTNVVASMDRDDLEVREELGHATSDPIVLKASTEEAIPGSPLEHCDSLMSTVGNVLQQHSVDFDAAGQSKSLIRIPSQLGKPRPLTELDRQDSTIDNFLHFIRNRRLCLLYMVENEGGEVELTPRDRFGFAEARLSISKNKLLIFRHDMFNYKYTPHGDSLALQSWILAQPPQVIYSNVMGMDQEEKDDLRGISGPRMPLGEQTNVKSIGLRIPGATYDAHQEWAMVVGGTDCLTEWPRARYPIEPYYTPDSQEALATGRSYTKHGAYTDTMMLQSFDPEFFEMNETQVRATSAEQRLAMDIGYQCVHNAGFTRKTIGGKPLGMFAAIYSTAWFNFVDRADMDLRWKGTMSHVTSTRLSYFLGTTGPIMSIETACSSSLVATSSADYNLRHSPSARGLRANLAMGVMTHVEPSIYSALCVMGMLSQKGRCFTFDLSADGFARGEGCGVVLLESGMPTDSAVMSTIGGSAVNQDGRSASITAPNGPSQNENIRASMRMAQIDSEQLSISECHGTGTALGDPIEVGAIRAALHDRKHTLMVTTVKSNISHMEASAGVSGVIKCTAMVYHGAVPSSVHFFSLNPHLELEGFPWYILNEMCAPGRSNQYAGVQGFGMGGTNARADFWGCVKDGPFEPSQKMLNFDLADFITTPCPVCLGPMCHLCGVSIPKYCVEKKKHSCCLIRDRTEYDICSNCYQGSFLFGAPLQQPALLPSEPVFVVGTWSSWSTAHELTMVSDGVYAFAVEIGDFLQERFHFILNQDLAQSLYPNIKKADHHAQVIGPDADVGGRHWCIDAVKDGLPVGAVYRVELLWDPISGARQVRWEATDSSLELNTISSSSYKHKYYVTGSWGNWTYQRMLSKSNEENMYEVTFHIGATGKEQFQIVRDKDKTQVFYPGSVGDSQDRLHVLGPNEFSEGRRWDVFGEVGEEVQIKLCLQGGVVLVFINSKKRREIVSVSKPLVHDFYVVGSFNDWIPSLMLADPEHRGIFRLAVKIGSQNCEEFQILANCDWAQRMYPARPHAHMGEVVMMGPDGEGDDQNWLMVGAHGLTMEIIFDENEPDRRKRVRWNSPDSMMLQ